MLAGSAAFVDEARIWLRRHGGNLVTQFPVAAIAEQSFDDRIARMSAYRDAARRVAGALARYPEVVVRPRLPPTNMLRAFWSGEAAQFMSRAQQVAREQSVWTIHRLAVADVPGNGALGNLVRRCLRCRARRNVAERLGGTVRAGLSIGALDAYARCSVRVQLF
jgi:threonine aldolase